MANFHPQAFRSPLLAASSCTVNGAACPTPKPSSTPRPSLNDKNFHSQPMHSHGLAVDSSRFPLHPASTQDCKFRVISAQEYAQLNYDHSTAKTPHTTVFPWLHGCDVESSAQAAYFGFSTLRPDVPRFRGLVAITADPVGRPHRSSSLKSSSSLGSSSSSSYTDSLFEDVSPPSSSTSCGSEPNSSLLTSSFYPSEVITPVGTAPRFLRPGINLSQINLRHYKIQPAKYASISDIVIYSHNGGFTGECVDLAKRFVAAHATLYGERCLSGARPLSYNVYVVADPFSVFESQLPHLVAVDSNGFPNNKIDFEQREAEEMRALTGAGEIAPNVYLGSQEDVPLVYSAAIRNRFSFESSASLGHLDADDFEASANPHSFSVCIEAHEGVVAETSRSGMPDHRLLSSYQNHLEVLEKLNSKASKESAPLQLGVQEIVHTECVSTFSNCRTHAGVNFFVHRIVELVMWMRRQAIANRRILVYGNDGYTDSSVLALSYIMYNQGVTLSEAYLKLQNEQNRSFFVYPRDGDTLIRVQNLLLAHCKNEGRLEAEIAPSPSILETAASPFTSAWKRLGLFRPPTPSGAHTPSSYTPRASPIPSATEYVQHSWYKSPSWDGNFPSRILPFLYLGNLQHASNPHMCQSLGITHVISIGETAQHPPRPGHSWSDGDNQLYHEAQVGRMHVLELPSIADDGIATIEPVLQPAIKFIEDARQAGSRVLVHCKVGVSRSATIVLAYVMHHLNLPLAEAYLLVRSRRLNILIQPTLLFMWTLHQLEEDIRGTGFQGDKLEAKRTARLTWPALASEMTKLNARYLS